jgi:hypothetical protein
MLNDVRCRFFSRYLSIMKKPTKVSDPPASTPWKIRLKNQTQFVRFECANHIQIDYMQNVSSYRIRLTLFHIV